MADKRKKEYLDNIRAIRNLNNAMSLDASGNTARTKRSIDRTTNDFNSVTNTLGQYGQNRSDLSKSPVKSLSSIAKNDGNNKVVDEDMVNQINKLFKNPNEVSAISKAYRETLLRNRMYDDYDLLMKFLPLTKSIIKDTVVPALLSPNDHTKTFLSIKPSSGIDENNNKEKIYDRMQEDYDFPNKIKQISERAAMYGIDRNRVVSYSVLMTRLMRNMNNIDRALLGASSTSNGINESANILECLLSKSVDNKIDEENGLKIVQESMGEFKNDFDTWGQSISNSNTAFVEMNNNLIKRVNESVILEEPDYLKPIQEMLAFNKVNDNIVLKEFCGSNVTQLESMTNIIESSFFETLDKNKLGTATKIGKGRQSAQTKTQDGFFAINDINDKDKDRVKVKGVFSENLNLRKTLPCKIGDITIGYYIMDFFKSQDRYSGVDRNVNLLSNPYNSLTMKDLEKQFDMNDDRYSDNYTMTFAKMLCKRINKKFIENNQDFVENLYSILRYYDIHCHDVNVKMQFIPADEVVEFTVNNGISMLDDALFPGKLYIALMISNLMLKLLRNADKRVYYIKQGIDTNVTNSLMHAITSIKKSEISLSDFGNLNKMFGYLGRFSDLFVPVSPDGDRPFDFEIMSGQDVQVNDEFMEELKKATIIALGTPYGIADYDERTDLATRLVSENIKFAHKIKYMQIELSRCLSKYATKFMRAIDPEHEDELKVMLPAPMNLKLNTLNEQLSGIQQVAQLIAETVIVDKDSENANLTIEILKREVFEDLAGPLLDWSKYKNMAENSKTKATEIKSKIKLEEDIANATPTEDDGGGF